MSVLNFFLRFIANGLLLLSLTACSTIKSYFPDKEREYVNSVEIAPLVIPPDLSTPNFAKDKINTVVPVTDSTPASTPTPVTAVTEAPAIAQNTTATDQGIAEKKSPNKAEPNTKNKTKAKTAESGKVRLVSYAGGATRLQIDEPYVRAWRIVGKSLTRKSLEIIDRNINDGLFLIQYDPIETNTEDGSLWDEVVFLFGDDKSNEKEYQIRLIEDKGITEVLVLDENGKPLSHDIGLQLLNLMHDTIKAGFVEPEP